MVNFPRLVNKVYDDGARIFVELGPDATCSHWIDAILQEKKHLAIPIDIKDKSNVDNLYNLLAALLSHGVPVNLSLLY